MDKGTNTFKKGPITKEKKKENSEGGGEITGEKSGGKEGYGFG